MPRNHEWQTRIKAVEREYLATRQATDCFLESVLRDPTVIRGDLRHREILHAADNLEATYVIRLFAEFETGLRLYWESARGTHPRTIDLLRGLAAMCKIPEERERNAHRVRGYRNSLVHERDEDEDLSIPIPQCRSALCHFFSFLPPEW
jgi:hypothetical protein